MEIEEEGEILADGNMDVAPRRLRSLMTDVPKSSVYTTGRKGMKFGSKVSRGISQGSNDRELKDVHEYFETLLHDRPGEWDGEQWIFLLVLFIVIDLIWCAFCCLCRRRGTVGGYRGGYMV